MYDTTSSEKFFCQQSPLLLVSLARDRGLGVCISTKEGGIVLASFLLTMLTLLPSPAGPAFLLRFGAFRAAKTPVSFSFVAAAYLSS